MVKNTILSSLVGLCFLGLVTNDASAESESGKTQYVVNVESIAVTEGDGPNIPLPVGKMVRLGEYICGTTFTSNDNISVVELMCTSDGDNLFSTVAGCDNTKPGNSDNGYFRLYKGHDVLAHMKIRCTTSRKPVPQDEN